MSGIDVVDELVCLFGVSWRLRAFEEELFFFFIDVGGALLV